MNYFAKFGDFQFDVLREVGNIGAGHAATALSK
ncbi:MAG: chemotaxis protein CheC, partial [Brevibacillus sp.]